MIIFYFILLPLASCAGDFISSDVLDLILALSRMSGDDVLQATRKLDNQKCAEHVTAYVNVLTKEKWAARTNLENVFVDSVVPAESTDLITNGDPRTKKSLRKKVFDSSAKIPNGLLSGNLIHMGQFDECLKIEGPAGAFRGQHCMVDLNLSLSNQTMNLFYGVCVPSSCSSQDLEYLFKNLINSLPEIASSIDVTVIPQNCRIRGGNSFNTEDWVVVGALVFFVIIAICSTVYDVFQRLKKNNEKPNQLLSAFSWYSNGKALLKITKNTDQIQAIYGLRTISMGWVVLGHVYFNTMSSPVMNLDAMPELAEDVSHAVIFNAFMSADTFFLLSGMLVCMAFFGNMSSNNSFDAPKNFIHRYIRLTPSYAIMILLEVTILNRIGNGPMWYRTHHQSSKNCEDYWWTSLIYVQNYVNPLKICLEQTWYLSADMQMFWVAPILLYPLYLWPVVGCGLLIAAIMATSWATFAVDYVNDLPPNVALHPSDDRVILDYYPTHARLAPWLIGVALGYLLCGVKAKRINIKLSAFWTAAGWILSTVLMTASFNSMTYFTQLPVTYTSLEAAFYLAFHRVGWALGLAWIVFASATDIGGLPNAILSFKVFQPLAKLSYGAYIIHYSLQRFRIGMLRTNVYAQDLDLVYLFITDFILSNLLAVPMYLLFERPFLHLDRYFFGSMKIFPYPKYQLSPQNINAQEKLNSATEEDIENATTNEASRMSKERHFQ